MTKLNTIGEVRDLVNSTNYYYNGNEYELYSEMQAAAEEHFSNVTASYEDQAEYYHKFGLNVGEARIELVKIEKYYVEEENTTVSVEFYEAYVDSGVCEEDYFHAFMLNYED